MDTESEETCQKTNLTFRSISDLKVVTDGSKPDTSLKKIHPSELELTRHVDYMDDFFHDFGNGNRKTTACSLAL